MVATVENAVLAFFGYLIGNVHAAVAEYAARHVQLDKGAEINLFKGATWKFVTGSFFSVLVAQILQVAFAGLVADGAIEGVVDEQELDNAVSCVDHFFAGNVFHDHAVHHIRSAARHEFRHWPWVGGGTLGHFHEAGAAFSAAALQWGVVAHCRWCNISTDLACGLQDACPGLHLNGDVVYGYFK